MPNLRENMKLRIRDLNITEDAKEINRILSVLRFRFNMNYRGSQQFFWSCDPSITVSRFDELCCIADYVP